jgi:divalent metal cation (Fe/Co/Zn/Cd) transporter
MTVADVQIGVDATISVEAGHDIAVAARQHEWARHRVLNVMTHVDTRKRVGTSALAGQASA